MSNQPYQTESQSEDDDYQRLRELVFPATVGVGDQVSGQVTSIAGERSDLQVKITRISPLGVQLVIPRERKSLSKGEHLDLVLLLGTERNAFSGLVVENVENLAREQVVTVRLIQPDTPRTDDSERRGSLRWLCSEQFYPTAIAANPARYNDFIYFKINDLSRTGARLTTSLRNKYIVNGMTLDCLASFPLVSQVRLEMAVRNVTIAHENGKDVLSVGVEFVAPEHRNLSVIAQYLLQFGDTESLESLRDEGLIPTSVGKAVEYSFVRTEEEYEQVLQLRAESYDEAGKLGNDATPEQMADSYDAKARIIIGKYRGRVVSSARVYFPEYGDTLEQEEFVPWPTSFGRRDEVVEIMRVCTHRDFRRSDLLFSLFHFMAITAIQAKRHKVVGCATEKLLPLYLKVGFKSTGLTYNLPVLNNLKHTLIVGDARRSLLGLDVGPLVWNVLWKDASDYLVENRYVVPDLYAQLRLLIYRSLGPLAHTLRSRARKPRRAARPQGAY